MRNKNALLCCLAALLIFTSCKKESVCEERMPPAENGEGGVPAAMQFYFRGTIDGVYKDWTVTDPKNGEALPYRFNSASGVDTLGGDCVNTFCKFMIEGVVIFQNNGAGPTKNYIAAGFNMGSKTGNRSEIISQFAPGMKAFGKPRFSISDPVKDGAYVYYIDGNGKQWSTHWGSGVQTGSSFSSEALLPQPFTYISCNNIWRVKFTCNLYDNSGNAIRVENGEFFTPVLVRK